jgi:PBP1b-binding outer membrane lipoprotein LpoB
MRKIILAIALLAACAANAQTGESLRARAEQLKRQVDSSNKSLSVTMNSTQQMLDSMHNAEIKKQAQRSGEMMLQWHKQRQAKQKKQMFLYFGLGLFFLVVLVFGLMRKGKGGKSS